jgi:hypothetical protein
MFTVVPPGNDREPRGVYRQRMRFVALIGIVAVAALGAASLALSKEGARGRLTTTVPLEAAPGTNVRVGWTVDVPDGAGGREPFGAMHMFLRLLSRTGAAATTGFARETSGRYKTDVSVPAGGIGGIRVGLRGSTEIFFPLENDPFRSRDGVRCDVAALRATLTAFVRAYNRGNLRRLDSLFSRERFVWYSSPAPGERLFRAAESRETLVPYFRGRHRRGDRLTISTYRFNSYERERDLGHFELTGRRRAAGFRGGRWFTIGAKGALDCSKPPVTIAVFSLGGR